MLIPFLFFEIRIQKSRWKICVVPFLLNIERFINFYFDLIIKRNETLGIEYDQRWKRNKFVDRRFGETNENLSYEDKMLLRFQKTRQVPLLFDMQYKKIIIIYFSYQFWILTFCK
jgi:hypothetical protein